MKNPNERICAFKVNMINSDVLSQLKQLEKDGYITAINVGTYAEENTHEVYVVFYDGEAYKPRGSHGVYANKAQAKACITRSVEKKARENASRRNERWFHKDFSEQHELIEKEKALFEIKTYTECAKIKDL